jgi:hypothetical protein
MINHGNRDQAGAAMAAPEEGPRNLDALVRALAHRPAAADRPGMARRTVHLRPLPHRSQEDNQVIILPRSQIAHLASCGHWVCVHARAAQVGDRELCGLCALSAADDREQRQAMLGRGDGQPRDQADVDV